LRILYCYIREPNSSKNKEDSHGYLSCSKIIANEMILCYDVMKVNVVLEGDAIWIIRKESYLL
jgi:hypothetical protein